MLRVLDAETKPRSSILYELEASDQGHGQAIQRAVAVKLAFHGDDADTDTDILATILARMSVSVSVSASWNASLIQAWHDKCDDPVNGTPQLAPDARRNVMHLTPFTVRRT